MAWSFGDSFDLYAAAADAANGYWDSGSVASTNLVTGRFSGSRAINFPAGQSLTKASSVNDSVHHLVVSFQQTSVITGSGLGHYLELFDGATAQCSIVFRTDGAIVLASGGPTGTALATYTGAFTVINTWYAFEFEVTINNTTGIFNVRKNGNTVNDFAATALNTRGGTANNYANKLQIGSNAGSGNQFDDFFWQSGAATGAWLGDIRCYARMPASDQSVTFSRTSTGALTQTVPTVASSTNGGSNTASYTAFTANYSGTITSVGVAVTTISTAVNMKCAIFADNGSGSPGALLASATAPVNPVTTGTNTFAFSGVSVTKGVQYWIGAVMDGSGSLFTVGVSSAAGASNSVSYASFPQTNPVTTMPTAVALKSMTYTSTPANWQAVSEPQEDGLTSYVFDSNPGDADLYGVGSIASTPATVIATTIRAYMQKSDAGTRTAAVQLKSGSATVASPTLVLTTSGWLWAWRTDLTDPNTGAAWTPAAVNNAQVGPKVIA